MVTRTAAPYTPPARTRTRTRAQSAAPTQPARPVAVSGRVTGIVELDERREGRARRLETEHVTAERRLPKGVDQVAQVTVKGGITLSPVQYESIRIDVSLSLPSAPEPEAYEAAYAEARDWVNGKIAEQVSEAGLDRA